MAIESTEQDRLTDEGLPHASREEVHYVGRRKEYEAEMQKTSAAR